MSICKRQLICDSFHPHIKYCTRILTFQFGGKVPFLPCKPVECNTLLCSSASRFFLDTRLLLNCHSDSHPCCWRSTFPLSRSAATITLKSTPNSASERMLYQGFSCKLTSVPASLWSNEYEVTFTRRIAA